MDNLGHLFNGKGVLRVVCMHVTGFFGSRAPLAVAPRIRSAAPARNVTICA